MHMDKDLLEVQRKNLSNLLKSVMKTKFYLKKSNLLMSIRMMQLAWKEKIKFF